jgi:3-isopropylmalate/(R)-2-methylmalate dehydratase large subunit
MTTLLDKIWTTHLVAQDPSGDDLLYIDRHLIHEVSSPQAFTALAEAGRGVRSTARHLAVQDHNVPTTADRLVHIPNAQSAAQIDTLRRNARMFGIRLLDLDDSGQGIVHVVAPEQGHVLPGATVVCGDSHTATLGALGALACGVGTSEVEHVMSTQTLWMRKPRSLGIEITGALLPGVHAKDLALAVIRRVGTSGGVGHAIEYHGEAVNGLSMEARLTLCNMTIEAGSRFGLVAPDATTIAYLRERVRGAAREHFEQAAAEWATLRTDSPTDHDRQVRLDAGTVVPMVTWGTTPADSAALTGRVGDGFDGGGADEQARIDAALAYMGLRWGQPLDAVTIDVAFIGSCTNSRIEDLRAAAAVLHGRHIAQGVRGLVVPGSTAVKRAAEAEGLHRVFLDAGFEWRESGCSMCIGMNGDALVAGQRCASTSNRNFENRQGQGGRTHLMSPAAVAASAISGRLADPREVTS